MLNTVQYCTFTMQNICNLFIINWIFPFNPMLLTSCTSPANCGCQELKTHLANAALVEEETERNSRILQLYTQGSKLGKK